MGNDLVLSSDKAHAGSGRWSVGVHWSVGVLWAVGVRWAVGVLWAVGCPGLRGRTLPLSPFHRR